MRRIGMSAAWMALFLCAGLAGNRDVRAESALDEARSSTSRMDRWLGRSENARRWRVFLNHDRLREELARGDRADPATLSEILDKYTSDTPGLDHPRFAATREALRRWLIEVSPPDDEQLLRMVGDAADQFRPITEEDVEQSRRRLSGRLRMLDRFLSRGRRADREGWRRFLNWNELRQQLDSPEKPDLAQLDQVLKQFEQDQPGLELTEFSDVRDALRRFGTTVYYARPDTEQLYERRIGRLAEQLRTYVENHDNASAIEVGQTLGWLSRLGQTPVLVRAIRRGHDRPNLYASISSRFIESAAAEDVNEQDRVYENILGVSVRADTEMRGRLAARLVPDDRRGTVEILLRGDVRSRNVGYRRPVTIYSRGNTSVEASKAIWLSGEGIQSESARADCRTRTRITGVGASHNLIRTLAWNQISRKHGQAESVASRKAERRVRRKMDQQAGERLAESNETYRTKFRDPLLRRDGFPQSVSTSSDEQYLHIRVAQADEDQLAAPDEPPAMPGTDTDLVVRMHESMVGNFSESAIGDYTLTARKLAEIYRELTGDVPEELRADEDGDWSIRFADVAPVRMTFRDGQLRAAIRGNRFTRGDQVVERAMEIAAAYKVETGPETTKIVRQGDVSVEYFGRTDTLSVAEVALKTFFKKKFEAMFKPEFESEGIKFKKRLEKVGILKLDRYASENGWLSLGWTLRPPERTAEQDEAADRVASSD